MPLTPKASRYVERRPYPPGVHGRSKLDRGAYAIRLLEKQLRRTYAVARRRSGQTGEELIAEPETRLSSIVYRSGIAPTIDAARQFVSHGHIKVDGCKADRPSYHVRPGQIVTVAERSRALKPFMNSAGGADLARPAPRYLDVDLAHLRVALLHRPSRADVQIDVDERLVVEHYTH